ncbi:MAG: hypothetical protein HYY01_14270 [Chloroflexi bacterium]|nr:hypothetical protein [Chloroflexota bacterium]
MLRGVEVVPPEKYVGALYRDSPTALEHDLHAVPTDLTFYRLVDADLIKRDQAWFSNLSPVAPQVVILADAPGAVTATDRLLSLGYTTRVLLLPSLLRSPDLPAQRQGALVLWVWRQSSIREGLRAARGASKAALVVAGLATTDLGQEMPPHRLISLASRSAAGLEVVVLCPAWSTALDEFAAECRVKGIRATIIAAGESEAVS